MEVPLRAGAVPHADGHLSNVSMIASEGERWDFVGSSRKDPTLNLLGPAVAIELAIRYQINCIYHYASDSVVVASSASQHRAPPVAAPYVGVALD